MHIYISKLLKKGVAAMMLAVNAPSLICRFNLAAPVYSVECFSHVDLIYVLRVRPITAAIESSY